ncbi:major facilitator superfamily domain-containing protein [Melanogaster broomeanus]|nr:major facilitator superfamily domain-containing protein [Melanogaster broomeanus]
MSPTLKTVAEQVEHPVPITVTPQQETKIWRKIDWRVIPIIAVMYLFALTDRGNAKIEGMTTQLDLHRKQFSHLTLSCGWLTNAFPDDVLHTLLSFGGPSNQFKLYDQSRQAYDTPHLHLSDADTRWLPGIMVEYILDLSRFCLKDAHGFREDVCVYVSALQKLDSILALCTSECISVRSFIVLTSNHSLTMWYPRYKLQYRIALFAGAAGIAGAFSGFLSFALDNMNGVGGLQAWSWIFYLHLSPPFVMIDYPLTAKFLTEDERSFVVEAQARDVVIGEDHHGVAKQVWAGITDWQISGYALVYFLPFGYSPSISQLLTIPPYVLTVMVLLMFSHFSDKLHLRSPFIFAAQSIALVGFIINISDAPSGVKYFGLCLCLVGSAAGTGAVSWLANNLRGKYKRPAGMALQMTSGSVGGAIASNIFRSQDAPRYIYGIGLEIIFIGTGLAAILVTAVAYKRINAARDREELLQQQRGQKGDLRREEGAGAVMMCEAAALRRSFPDASESNHKFELGSNLWCFVLVNVCSGSTGLSGVGSTASYGERQMTPRQSKDVDGKTECALSSGYTRQRLPMALDSNHCAGIPASPKGDSASGLR